MWANRQRKRSGRIPKEVVPMLCPSTGRREVKRLLEAGLWTEDGEHYAIHDYGQWNGWTPQLAEKRADAGRRGGKASGQTRSKREANAKQLASKAPATGEADREAKGSTRAGSTTTTSIPVEVDPGPDGSRHTGEQNQVSSLRDPLAYLTGKAPGQRADVGELHEAYKATFGFTARVLGPHDVDAHILATAIDRYGIERCLLVLKHAPSDGMVNGARDEGKRHDSIRYVFDNQDTFARILRDAEKTAPEQRRKRKASEVIAEAKARRCDS